MEEQEKQEEVKEEVVAEEEVKEVVAEVPVEQTEEEKETEREKNLKAENRRKAEELAQLREELQRAREHQPVQEDITTILKRMSDRELESYLNNAQYSANHIQIREILDERRYDRYHARKEEQRARLDSEIELESKFPDVLNPSHPMALKTKELMRLHRLENHPQGRLIAARLAASELGKTKAVAAGRKAEQNRQTDVKANFQGESARPAPVKSDKVKLEELKKKAMAGDPVARAEWFKQRGLA